MKQGKITRPTYKLPRCWLGTPRSVHIVTKKGIQVVVVERTEIDVEVYACKCKTARQAFNCVQGHLDECHVGLSCADAQCSRHIRRYGGKYAQS